MNWIGNIYKNCVPLKIRYRIYNLRTNKSWNDPSDSVLNSYNFFKKTNTIFIHIPKTAGISLYKNLYGIDSYGHIKLEEYYHRFPKQTINNRFKFTFVRDPLTRVFSAYNYLRKGGRGKPLDFEYQDVIDSCNSFEEFIFDYLQKVEIKNMQHFLPQVDYLKDIDGDINVDFVGRFENLNNDYHYVVKKLNLSGENLSMLNSNRAGRSIQFTSEIRAMVRKIYLEDYVSLGYK